MKHILAKLAGAVEYTNCISAMRHPNNKYPGYDPKQLDYEASVLELWRM